ncbi:hypothetical protein ACRALDRAFT_2064536, partial [Sodiomyces alcalophilus JCM 7366]|uniref:uncharacterized protein n=1 Tax=Sodiomyces alcalophilus JCM 7366 TaxID=591952 RepID=UPI0039B52F88
MTPEELEGLLAAPALEPPPGVIPNFENPPNRNGLAVAVTTLCIAISTLCLFLRAYVRMWREKTIHKEEVLMFLSYGALWGTAYAAYEMVAAPGYYVHQWHLTNGDLVRPLWLILVYGCCYSIVLPLIKTAILLDWCRVFISSDRYKNAFWWSCMILSVFQCLWGIACVILLNLQCRPHHAIWEFYVPAQCYDLPSVMLGSGSVQVATDVIMVLLPQRIIWSLHMNWQRKLGVSIIFGVGLVACVAACVRLSHTVTFANEPDKMYFIGPLLFWAWGEMAAGFFILSVPCLPKLASRLSLPSRVRSLFGLS